VEQLTDSVRSLRFDLISRALVDPDFDSPANLNKKVIVALRIVGKCCRCENIPEEDARLLESKLGGPDKHHGHLEKFFSPSRCESDSLTAMGHGRMERASHGADGLFRC